MNTVKNMEMSDKDTITASVSNSATLSPDTPAPGLSSNEAQQRQLAQYSENTLIEHHTTLAGCLLHSF